MKLRILLLSILLLLFVGPGVSAQSTVHVASYVYQPSYVWLYTVVTEQPADISLETNCLITEAGVWSNWTPGAHIDLELFGGQSSVIGKSLATWHPASRFENIYVLTNEIADNANGHLIVNGKRYDAIVPQCSTVENFLPLSLRRH